MSDTPKREILKHLSMIVVVAALAVLTYNVVFTDPSTPLWLTTLAGAFILSDVLIIGYRSYEIHAVVRGEPA